MRKLHHPIFNPFTTVDTIFIIQNLTVCRVGSTKSNDAISLKSLFVNRFFVSLLVILFYYPVSYSTPATIKLQCALTLCDHDPLQSSSLCRHGLLIAYRGWIINFIAVLSSPSMTISANAGTHTKSMPDGDTNPLAIAIALIA
jgi:hypothetical protein